MKFFLFTLLLFCAISVYGQRSASLNKGQKDSIQLKEDTLSLLARGFFVSELQDDRLYACRQFIPALVRTLKVTNSFQYSFPRLENISITYAPDSSFRIFTWQLKVDDGDYRYYGALQWNQPSIKLIPLLDRSGTINSLTPGLTADNWYGVVYYAIKSFKSNKSDAYLLFGYDSYSPDESRKIIDVLYFDKGKPYFGKPVFVFDKGPAKSRIIYQYKKDAAIRVNYDEDEKMIICDHLIENSAALDGQTKVMVPDGSYEGFKLNKDKWVYVENVFPSNSPENQRALRTKPKVVIEKK